MRHGEVGVGGQRQNAVGGVHLAQPPEASHRLEPHARARVGEGGEERRGRNFRGESRVVGECLERVFAQVVLLGHFREERRGLRAGELLERGQRRYARGEICARPSDLLKTLHRARRRAARQQFALRGEPHHRACGADACHELRWRHLLQIRKCFRLLPLRREPDDVAHLRPRVGERRPVPARRVEPPGAVHVQIRPARHLHELLELLRLHLPRRARWRQRMPLDLARAPLHRIEPAAPRLRHRRFIEENGTHRRAAAEVRHRRDHLVGEVFVERGITHLRAHRVVAQPDIPPAAVVRIVAREQVQRRADRHRQDVARPAHHQLHPRAIGPHPNDAPALQRQRAPVFPLRLHRPVVAHRDVNPAINAHPAAIGRVIRAAEIQPEAQPRDQVHLLLRHPVAIGIRVGREVRRVHAEKRARARVPDHPARTVHLRESREHIRLPVAVRVLAPHDLSAIRLAIQRPIFIARHKQRPIRRRADEHRIRDMGRRRENRGLKLRRERHPLQNLRRRSQWCGRRIRRRGIGGEKRRAERGASESEEDWGAVHKCAGKTQAGDPS